MFFPKIREKLSARTIVVFSGIFIGISCLGYTLGTILQEYVVAIYVLTVVLSLIIGVTASLIMATLSVQFMSVVEQDYLARVGAIFNAGACAATPVVSMLVSILSTRLTVAQVFQTSGILCVILFIIIGIKKVKLE